VTMIQTSKITLALADDHSLFRKGMAGLLTSLTRFEILFDAANGKELLDMLDPANLPQIVLMDINMPELDGYETSAALHKKYPEVKIIALSMYDNEFSIIRMLKNGANGYLLKDCDPAELVRAIESVAKNGYYHSELLSGRLLHALAGESAVPELTEKEITFLRYCCTDYTYKEIAERLSLSPRTVEGYRDILFDKLQTKSRTGLAMYAIKSGIVQI